jgi:ABC-type nitrate/sulfonate/bicarbonate transport system ATPase subunit
LNADFVWIARYFRMLRRTRGEFEILNGVGFLAAGPGVVLMDEPFSALDCQTRNRLQAFLLDVWTRRRDTIMFVTHNIEEAAFVSDRIVVLTPRPSTVAAVLDVDLPRPRHRTDPGLTALRARTLSLLNRLSRQEH